MSEIDEALNGYLASLGQLTPSMLQVAARAYLTGYNDGLTKGGEIAERAIENAADAIRVSHDPQRQAAEDDPRGARDR